MLLKKRRKSCKAFVGGDGAGGMMKCWLDCMIDGERC